MLINTIHKKSRGKQDQIKVYCYDMRDLKFNMTPSKAGMKII